MAEKFRKSGIKAQKANLEKPERVLEQQRISGEQIEQRFVYREPFQLECVFIEKMRKM